MSENLGAAATTTDAGTAAPAAAGAQAAPAAAPAATPSAPAAAQPSASTETTQSEKDGAAKPATPSTQDAAKSEAAKQGTDPKAAKADEKPVVPEKYDLKLPDGSKLSAKAIEELSSFAKEKGLSNEVAQSMLERENQAVAAFEAAQLQQLDATIAAWQGQAAKDPEIGGQAFKENAELAHRVVSRFASPAFVQELNKTGFGNHPELVRTFVRIGKLMSDDKLVLAGPDSGPREKSAAEILYGNTN